MTSSPRAPSSPPEQGDPDSPGDQHTAVFGWPHAFVLATLVPATFTFAFLLMRAGQDARTAVTTTLALLTGTAVIVLPAAGAGLLRRLGAAAGAGFGGRR